MFTRQGSSQARVEEGLLCLGCDFSSPQQKKQRADFRTLLSTVRDPKVGYEELSALNEEGLRVYSV